MNCGPTRPVRWNRLSQRSQTANTGFVTFQNFICLYGPCFLGPVQTEAFKQRGQRLRNDCGGLQKLIFNYRVTVTSD
jgi:hypothetical protein